MRSTLASIRIRQLHVAGCLGLLLFVSWGLLTSDPLAVVKRSPFSVLTTVSDLLMHCGVYSVFSLACCTAVSRAREPWVLKAVLALLVFHGLATEVLQTWVPCRTCDPLDALANMTGIASGAVLATRVFSLRVGKSTVAG